MLGIIKERMSKRKEGEKKVEISSVFLVENVNNILNVESKEKKEDLNSENHQPTDVGYLNFFNKIKYSNLRLFNEKFKIFFFRGNFWVFKKTKIYQNIGFELV